MVPLHFNSGISLRLGGGIGIYFHFGLSKAGDIEGESLNYEDGAVLMKTVFSKNKMVYLGRTDQCQILIKHAIVSRQHLEMKLHKNIFYLKDLGSTNGTYIKNDRMAVNIDDYLKDHPVDPKKEQTMDEVHEVFGPTLDDFLSDYVKGQLV